MLLILGTCLQIPFIASKGLAQFPDPFPWTSWECPFQIAIPWKVPQEENTRQVSCSISKVSIPTISI